jgi:Beta-lactamase enzyme family
MRKYRCGVAGRSAVVQSWSVGGRSSAGVGDTCHPRAVQLEADVRQVLAGKPGTFGIYARNLGTGERVAVNADTVLPTESTAKTFILVRYAGLVTAGALDPQRRITLTDDIRAYGSGVLRFLAPGLQPTLDDLAWLMIIVSDNLATSVVLREVGGADAVNETMAQLGLASARVNPAFSHADLLSGELFGTSTARDLAEVYTHLDERCRAILFHQQLVECLPRRLPHGYQSIDFGFDMPARVFTKTGNGLGNCIDSGRFETDTAAWVVAAMATDQQDFANRAGDVAPDAFADIGELLYERWGT